MTITHVMLDLETWGKKPGCDLRSIGACLFNPVTGDVCDTDEDGLFYIAVDNPWLTEGQGYDPRFKYPLIRDPETEDWWSDQSPEAQAAFINPVDLAEGLGKFGVWLMSLAGTNLRLWSHGPAFDPPILAAAYDAVGLPIPWNYRAPRDTRTAFDMAGVDDDGDGSYRTWLTQFNTGTAHHALDDAIAQAKAVCAAHAMVRHSPELIAEARLHIEAHRRMQLTASTTTADLIERLLNDGLDRVR